MRKLILLLLIVGCGKSPTVTVQNLGASSSGATSEVEILDSSKNLLGYVIGNASDQLSVYLPTQNKYVAIDSETGKYINSTVYYSNANCTGNAVTGLWPGDYSTAVVYAGSTYYSVSSLVTSTFSYASYWSILGCTATVGTANPANFETLGNLTVTTQPYDFTSLAPIQLVYN